MVQIYEIFKTIFKGQFFNLAMEKKFFGVCVCVCVHAQGRVCHAEGSVCETICCLFIFSNVFGEIHNTSEGKFVRFL